MDDSYEGAFVQTMCPASRFGLAVESLVTQFREIEAIGTMPARAESAKPEEATSVSPYLPRSLMSDGRYLHVCHSLISVKACVLVCKIIYSDPMDFRAQDHAVRSYTRNIKSNACQCHS